MATEYKGPKYVVVTGGVISGVGKGLTTASIGKILQQYGYSTTAVKIDPYINYDAGTMRPTEHGEVWVTDDGGEIDQDLGNYERFLGLDLPRSNNLTTGQIYLTVIERERRGEYPRRDRAADSPHYGRDYPPLAGGGRGLRHRVGRDRRHCRRLRK